MRGGDSASFHSITGLTGRHTAVVTTPLYCAPHRAIKDVGLVGSARSGIARQQCTGRRMPCSR
jgi:hypothetical protein